MRASSLWLLLLLAACATRSVPGLPGKVGSTSHEAQLRAVSAAETKVDAGDVLGAIAELEQARSLGLSVELERLRQDLLRQRGRLGALRIEAEERVRSQPDSGLAHYLLGRVQAPELAAPTFARAVALAPESVWPWLGLAFSQRERDPSKALRIYAGLYEASDAMQSVAIAYAGALRSSGKLREAVEIYDTLAKQGGRAMGIGSLGLAQTLLAMGVTGDERLRAMSAFLVAIAERPSDPGVHSIVRESMRAGVPDDQLEQCLDVLRSSPDRWQAFARGPGAEILSALMPRLGHPQAGIAALEAIPDADRAPAATAHLRRLLLEVGDTRAFHERLLRDIPARTLDAEDNQVRSIWRALLGTCAAGEDPCSDANRARGYVEALRDVGMLSEAETVAVLAQRRHGASSVPRELLEEIRREVAFENEVRRLLYRGYAKDESRDLGMFLADARRASLATLGRDVVGEDVRFSVPLVGEMLDPFAAGLCRHLARYNRHLVVGRRSGGTVEGLMFARLSLRDLPADPALPVPGRCREVLGIDRSVRSLSGVLGGDLAGVALMNHYIVDHDAVVEWAQSIARRQRIVNEDGGAALADPLPEDCDPLDPLDANFRLSASSSMQDTEITEAVLDCIRLHERRHLVDSFYYMPVESNLGRSIALLVQFGFSPHAIESEMERRAELAALALCKRPEVVLAHISEFLAEDDQGSPHVRGFTQLGRELIDALVKEGVAPEDAAVSRWHRLDPAMVRRAASRLLAELP